MAETDLPQVRMVVRVRTAAMETIQADLVAGMVRVVKGRVEALAIMEDRQMVLGREAMEGRMGTLGQEAMEDRMDSLGQETMADRTETLDREATEARTTTQAPTMDSVSQAPANQTKAVLSHRSTCTQLS